MRVLLDTGVLIEPGRLPLDAEVGVASVSFAELAFGVRTAVDLRVQALRQARLDRLRTEFGPGLPFDDDAANAFGVLAALVVAGGRNPRSRASDLMIAATAYVHDAGVVTRDVADFADITSLVPVHPARARPALERRGEVRLSASRASGGTGRRRAGSPS